MQYQNGKRAAIFGAVTAAWLAVLFFFSGQSGVESGELSGELTRYLFGWWIDRGADAMQLETLLRKAAHAGIFAVQGFLLGMTLLSCLRRREAVLLSVAGCALTAVANELHQLTAVERSCSVADMLIDLSGAMLGLAAAALLLRLLTTRNQ